MQETHYQMSEPIIELRNANIYQGNNLILQDVNLTVNKGEFVYLVGKTGTGKSSLLKTLYGELELKEGEATVAGFNLKGLDWKKYHTCAALSGWCSRIFSYSPTGM